uniref:NADH dehydrogenase subunit 6 n=1 Tax=Naesiotus nux TaxID=1755238 RepID=A0A0S2IAS5_NAENU|nr:NADH dehydrogenase subunit 6 [Naesiotus nux]ALO20557.1 NADH dehydrogenase subunit 6 [Naesiotus nux]
MNYILETMVCFIIMCSLLMSSVVNPLSMGLLMLLSATFSVFYISCSLYSWYAYILFLVFIGGLMVLLIYMCMLSSNLIVKISLRNLVLSSSFSISLVIIFNELIGVMELKNFLWSSSMISGLSVTSNLILLMGLILYFMFLGMVHIAFSSKSSVKIHND